jgi:tyrosyl-tRNA synthetase
LGKAIVARYYDQSAADAAADEFDRVFSSKQTPTEIPEITIPAGTIGIIALVVQAGFAKSNGEARRLISQNAVSIDNAKITDTEANVDPQNGQILRVGKRRFGKIILK